MKLYSTGVNGKKIPAKKGSISPKPNSFPLKKSRNNRKNQVSHIKRWTHFDPSFQNRKSRKRKPLKQNKILSDQVNTLDLSLISNIKHGRRK